MISVEEAIKHIVNAKVKKKRYKSALENALGLVLAQDIYSEIDIPSFSQSAMDGYAICGMHKEYTVSDEVQAGDTRKIILKDGEACRIFTGAAVPENTIAVIMQENVIVNLDYIVIEEEIIEGKNIRNIGEQLKKGECIFKHGHVLNAASLGLIQSLGLAHVDVFELPKISMAVTGNEVKPLGTQLNHGEIYESNSITISSAAKQNGFSIDSCKYIQDNYKDTKEILGRLIYNSDIVVVSGGISVGDYDFVKRALNENGVEEIFYKINQKPGKPLFFGKKEDKYIFGLPGNPAAALTCFYIYVIPLLKKIMGESNFKLEEKKVALKSSFTKKINKSLFLKGKLNQSTVEILDGQSSAMLHSFAYSNCLVYIPEEKMNLFADEIVTVYILP